MIGYITCSVSGYITCSVSDHVCNVSDHSGELFW